MTKPFGNEPAKTKRYLDFWNKTEVERPLVGFTLRGFYPMDEYPSTDQWQSDYLRPDMVNPKDFLVEEEQLLREGEAIDDDIIRGDSPLAAVVPWLSGMLGAKLRVLPGNVLGEDMDLSWEEIDKINLEKDNPWYQKYMEFAQAMVEHSQGRYPVSQGAFRGPSDIMGLFRGASQSILDMMIEPEKSRRVLNKATDIFIKITEDLWEQVPRFYDGYFDGMYQLWSPGPIARLQEDALALFSPTLYRDFIKPLDRKIAQHFPYSFIHLHSTSMIVLDELLDIEELKCYEINNDAGGPPVAEMLPHFKKVQEADKSLLIRGSFTSEELKMVMDTLSPRGLYLYILVKDREEIKRLKPIVGM